MTRTPRTHVDIELRRELFLGLADLVFETTVSASTLARWYGNTYAALESYSNSFKGAAKDQLWANLTRHNDTALAVARTYTSKTLLQTNIATLCAASHDADTRHISTQYQFFVQTGMYGRDYYQSTGYNPDAFLCGQYLFLAMSFDAGMRTQLEEALENNVL